MNIIVDTREQTPWAFPPDVEITSKKLDAGDYSLAGFEQLVAIERKSLNDMLGCITSGRERFIRELQRLRGYNTKAVIIESTIAEVQMNKYRSKVHPNAVIGSICSWQSRYGVPFIWAHNREISAGVCQTILRDCLKRYTQFVENVEKQGLRLAEGVTQ